MATLNYQNLFFLALKHSLHPKANRSLFEVEPIFDCKALMTNLKFDFYQNDEGFGVAAPADEVFDDNRLHTPVTQPENRLSFAVFTQDQDFYKDSFLPEETPGQFIYYFDNLDGTQVFSQALKQTSGMTTQLRLPIALGQLSGAMVEDQLHRLLDAQGREVSLTDRLFTDVENWRYTLSLAGLKPGRYQWQDINGVQNYYVCPASFARRAPVAVFHVFLHQGVDAEYQVIKYRQSAQTSEPDNKPIQFINEKSWGLYFSRFEFYWRYRVNTQELLPHSGLSVYGVDPSIDFEPEYQVVDHCHSDIVFTSNRVIHLDENLATFELYQSCVYAYCCQCHCHCHSEADCCDHYPDQHCHHGRGDGRGDQGRGNQGGGHQGRGNQGSRQQGRRYYQPPGSDNDSPQAYSLSPFDHQTPWHLHHQGSWDRGRWCCELHHGYCDCYAHECRIARLPRLSQKSIRFIEEDGKLIGEVTVDAEQDDHRHLYRPYVSCPPFGESSSQRYNTSADEPQLERNDPYPAYSSYESQQRDEPGQSDSRASAPFARQSNASDKRVDNRYAQPHEQGDQGDRYAQPREQGDQADRYAQPREQSSQGDRYAQPHEQDNQGDRYAQPREQGDQGDRYAQPRERDNQGDRYAQPREQGDQVGRYAQPHEQGSQIDRDNQADRYNRPGQSHRDTRTTRRDRR